MSLRVAINGFGRIGRMVYRRAAEFHDIHVVAVNGTAAAPALAHLLRYDSVHGTWPVRLEVDERGWTLGDRRTEVWSTRDPQQLPWDELGIDVVVEATGKFLTRETASVHLQNGASRVVLTAPTKRAQDADVTIVMGVNDDQYDPEQHRIISGSSCTTNCLAPVVKVLHEAFGIQEGMVTTVHAFTSDQRSLDNPHRDLRRARASSQSIVPTSTGAAESIGLVVPELAGRLRGLAVRVPTPNVSLVDLVARLQQPVDANTINEAFVAAARGQLQGILDVCDEPLVSVDFNHNPHSATVDLISTMVLPGGMVKVLAWYDNEWGYACRIVDLVRLAGGLRRPGTGAGTEAGNHGEGGRPPVGDSLYTTAPIR
ncbi:MAG: type I glyceraldehyde-3-phosphate dehydrogenase [Alicyclobacillaceae bacterium]|nr:type I glyceraldehyde-3-phosphate dehydrogenase [Alicyclobacillaceae bacterium]